MTHPNGEFFDFDPFRYGDLSYTSANFSIEKLLATARINDYEPDAESRKHFAAVMLSQYINDIPQYLILDDSFSYKETLDFHRALASLTELMCAGLGDEEQTFTYLHELLKVEAGVPFVVIDEDTACEGLVVSRPRLRVMQSDCSQSGFDLGFTVLKADQFPGEVECVGFPNFFAVNLDPLQAGACSQELFFGKDIFDAVRTIALNVIHSPDADDDLEATLQHAMATLQAVGNCAERISDVQPEELASLQTCRAIIKSAFHNYEWQMQCTANVSLDAIQRSVWFDPKNAVESQLYGLN